MKMLIDGKQYTNAAATNVLATFERQLDFDGKLWVRPSRDPKYLAKWKYYQERHLTEQVQAPPEA
jgi:hypothetical protein